MSTHTPGPWLVLPEEMDKPYLRVRGTRLGLRYKIANVLTPAHDGVLPGEAEETRANGRLIAAAPDLLEALQIVKAAFDKSSLSPYAYQTVVDAINKATQP